jgi:branched-chain amino acid transport system substrate-binding protein
MNRVTGRRLTAALAVFVLLAAACGGKEPSVSPTGGQAGEKPSFELRIGMVLGFTGDYAPYSEPADVAAKLSAERVRGAVQKAGLDITITLFSEDTQSSPAGAAEAAQKIVQSDKVNVIIGSVTTGETIPEAQQAAIPNKVVLITLATSPLITPVEDDGYLWRTVPSDAIQARKLAKYMSEQIGTGKVVNTLAPNSPGLVAFQDAFEAGWQEVGGQVGASVTYNPDQPAYDTDAQKLVANNPDAWMFYDAADGFVRFAPALVRTGKWDPARTFSGDALRITSLPKDAGADKVEGMSGTSLTTVGAPAGEEFNKLWDEKATLDQQYAEPHAFDAVILAFLAALRGGGSDGATIRDNLQAVSGPPGEVVTFLDLDKAVQLVLDGQDVNYEGASGAIDFDEKGDPTEGLYQIWKFENGELKVIVPHY